mmetsp:Transcript_3602/g.5613  ORF Transcript_3602/g.5613 Transcript_3602/m.5613 type:complete len:92 (-) Transcript_3602:578-853(-)
MKRHTIYGGVIAVFAITWMCLQTWKTVLPSTIAWYTDISPWYLLIVLGCYCLAKLGYDLFSFNDYPLEIKKLEKDIIEAKKDLARRGFKSK